MVSLPDGNDIPVGFAHILREGQAIGSFFLLKQVGIYQNDKEVPEALFKKGVRAGDIIYEDVNNDGDITGDDRQIAGSALPDFYGGLTNSFKFGQFDLLVFSTYSFGNKVYANYRRHLDNFSNQFNKRMEAINTRWTGAGTSNTTPRAIANMPHNNQRSTRFLEDGSFFRVKTITAGYTFSQKESSPFSLLRVYATVLNPFLFTRYSGLDPETSDSLNNSNFGIDQRSPPPLRTFTLGFNINF